MKRVFNVQLRIYCQDCKMSLKRLGIILLLLIINLLSFGESNKFNGAMISENTSFINDQCSTFGFSIPSIEEKQKLMDEAYASGLTYYKYDKLLPSDNSTQEFTGGVHLCKTPIYPDGDARVQESDDPQIRLEEVYFTLAECKFREGDISGAVDLINQVRMRAFALEDRESEKLTTVGFDKYALLREWGCEFIFEGRRRTDLIRNDVFLEDEWWDKAANSDSYRKFFPIPVQAINSNSLLERTPGYSY
jgi:hypothetical protein